MNLSRHPASADPTMSESTVAERWVEDYLDRLRAPLLGFVPLEDRGRFCEEIRQNLEGRREQFELDGFGPLAATQIALRKLGPPRKLGEAFVYEYQRHRGAGFLARFAGKPVWWAFVIYGQAALIALALLFGRLYLIAPEPNTFGLSVSEFRRFVPEPIPLPDHHPSWLVLWGFALLAPIAAGLLLGYLAPFANTVPALFGSAAASLLTFSLVSFDSTVWEGTLLAYLQLLWWVPIGTLATYFGSSLTIRHRSAREPWFGNRHP